MQLVASPVLVAPTAPSSVDAVGTGQTTATVTWVADNSVEQGSQVQIETPANSGSWADAAGGANPTATGARSFSVTGLSAGSTYRARVRRTNAAGSSGYTVSPEFGTYNPVSGVVPVPDVTLPVMPGSIGISSLLPTSYTATAPVATDNVGVASYQWAIGSGSWTTISSGGRVASITGRTPGATDALKMRSVDLAGNFSAELTANVTLPVAVSVTTSPPSATYAAGEAVTLSAVFAGSAPITYQWYRNGVAIVGAVGTNYSFVPTLGDSGASYTVTASNVGGSATTTAAVLTILTAASIIQQPVNQTTVEGLSASFSVAVSSPFTYTRQWKRNGVVIPGETGTSLVLDDVLLTQSGEVYTVDITARGVTITSSPASLTVQAALTPVAIGQQPTSQTVYDGQSVSFSVSATGSAPITYQWKRNGVNIPGAVGSSYTLVPATLADDGVEFTVAVTNAAGTDTSAPATLTVLQSAQSGLSYSLDLAEWAPGRVVTPPRGSFLTFYLQTGSTDYFAFDFSSKLQFDRLVSANASMSRYPRPVGNEAAVTASCAVHDSFAVAVLSAAGRTGVFTGVCTATAQGGRTLSIPFILRVTS